MVVRWSYHEYYDGFTTDNTSQSPLKISSPMESQNIPTVPIRSLKMGMKMMAS